MYARSEKIRANSLSGDCKLTQELGRGLGGFSKHHQVSYKILFLLADLVYNSRQTCVRRRSVISVTANDACPDKATAEQVVNEVFESCFNDTRPFDEVSCLPCNSEPCVLLIRNRYTSRLWCDHAQAGIIA